MRRGPLGISCVLIGCFSAPLKFLDISLRDCCDIFVHQIFSSVCQGKDTQVELRDAHFWDAIIHPSTTERRLVATKVEIQ